MLSFSKVNIKSVLKSEGFCNYCCVFKCTSNSSARWHFLYFVSYLKFGSTNLRLRWHSLGRFLNTAYHPQIPIGKKSSWNWEDILILFQNGKSIFLLKYTADHPNSFEFEYLVSFHECFGENMLLLKMWLWWKSAPHLNYIFCCFYLQTPFHYQWWDQIN